MNDIIEKYITESSEIIKNSLSLTNDIEKVINEIVTAIKNGNKLILFGNGGSAADAQHIAAELVGRYKVERKGLPAIAITTDSSALTCISNDYGYEQVFSRQVEALANTGDVVIGISTGGTSTNVISALDIAKNIGCKAIGFSGRDGGEMNAICDVNLVVPDDDTPRIQEMHILIGHTICQLIDNEFG